MVYNYILVMDNFVNVVNDWFDNCFVVDNICVVDNRCVMDYFLDNYVMVDNWGRNVMNYLDPVFVASDSNMEVTFEVLHVIMMETDWMSDDFLDVAHALHLFEKMLDFLFDLGQVVDLLDETLDSVMGFISDSHAFMFQMLDDIEEVVTLISQLMALSLDVMKSKLKVLDGFSEVMTFFLKFVALSF